MAPEGICPIGMNQPGFQQSDQDVDQGKNDKAYLARDDERDGFDSRRVDFVDASNLTFRYVESATRQEAHPALGFRALVLR